MSDKEKIDRLECLVGYLVGRSSLAHREEIDRAVKLVLGNNFNWFLHSRAFKELLEKEDETK